MAALRDRHDMAGKGLPLALVDMTGQCLDADAEAKIIATAKIIAEKSDAAEAGDPDRYHGGRVRRAGTDIRPTR